MFTRNDIHKFTASISLASILAPALGAQSEVRSTAPQEPTGASAKGYSTRISYPTGNKFQPFTQRTSSGVGPSAELPLTPVLLSIPRGLSTYPYLSSSRVGFPFGGTRAGLNTEPVPLNGARTTPPYPQSETRTGTQTESVPTTGSQTMPTGTPASAGGMSRRGGLTSTGEMTQSKAPVPNHSLPKTSAEAGQPLTSTGNRGSNTGAAGSTEPCPEVPASRPERDALELRTVNQVMQKSQSRLDQALQDMDKKQTYGIRRDKGFQNQYMQAEQVNALRGVGEGAAQATVAPLLKLDELPADVRAEYLTLLNGALFGGPTCSNGRRFEGPRPSTDELLDMARRTVERRRRFAGGGATTTGVNGGADEEFDFPDFEEYDESNDPTMGDWVDGAPPKIDHTGTSYFDDDDDDDDDHDEEEDVVDFPEDDEYDDIGDSYGESLQESDSEPLGTRDGEDTSDSAPEPPKKWLGEDSTKKIGRMTEHILELMDNGDHPDYDGEFEGLKLRDMIEELDFELSEREALWRTGVLEQRRLERERLQGEGGDVLGEEEWEDEDEDDGGHSWDSSMESAPHTWIPISDDPVATREQVEV
ncbi:MAG: hypothetical protein ACI9F9_001147, partial [Candidatus Paceibacteria bacterium]